MLREPRFSVDIQVDCATKDLFLANRITNIGRGGVFIEAQFPLQTEVHLRLTFPDTGTSIDVKGHVVWNYDMRKGTTRLVRGSGIRFTEMDPEDRAQLEKYLEDLERQTARAAASTGRPAHQRHTV
jgi:uncharacterized protein (TIGR02266 family)